jgi:hypothetical protein
MSVPATDGHVALMLDGFVGPRARHLDPAAFKNSPFLSSAAALRKRSTVASGGSTSLYPGIDTQEG